MGQKQVGTYDIHTYVETVHMSCIIREGYGDKTDN